MIELKKLTPFKYFTLTNFPYIEADFDALTNYELFCKIVEYVNSISSSQNDVIDDFNELLETWNTYKEYIDYIHDHLQEAVDNKLDQMVSDGTFTNLIAPLVPPVVRNWLDDHPEATTTVQDGSLTESKFANSLKLLTIKDYVTPEMFGAVGDGIEDDTSAIQDALDDGAIVVMNNHYKVTSSLTVSDNTTIMGVGTIDSYVTSELFSGTVSDISMDGLKFVNCCTTNDADGFPVGDVFNIIHHGYIHKCEFYYFRSFSDKMNTCSVLDKCVFQYLYLAFIRTGITDSMVTNCYINASKRAFTRTIMLRSLNNSAFIGNFCDYWRHCFRLQTGNRSSQITGNTFDDCKSVFQDFCMDVAITGNTFSNIKYVADNWSSYPPNLADQEGVWSIFLFDATTTNVSGVTDIKQINNVVFTGNLARNCNYYFYINETVSVYLYGTNRLMNNSMYGCEYLEHAGFLCTTNMINDGKSKGHYLDFWDGQTFDALPRASNSGSSAFIVKSYNGMRCIVGGEEYINIAGTWKQTTNAGV